VRWSRILCHRGGDRRVGSAGQHRTAPHANVVGGRAWRRRVVSGVPATAHVNRGLVRKTNAPPSRGDETLVPLRVGGASVLGSDGAPRGLAVSTARVAEQQPAWWKTAGARGEGAIGCVRGGRTNEGGRGEGGRSGHGLSTAHAQRAGRPLRWRPPPHGPWWVRGGGAAASRAPRPRCVRTQPQLCTHPDVTADAEVARASREERVGRLLLRDRSGLLRSFANHD